MEWDTLGFGPLNLVWMAIVASGPLYLIWLLVRNPFRRRALRDLAAKHGWSFAKRESKDLPRRLAAIPCLHGELGTAYNVLEGRHKGMPFALCTYQWHTGSGDYRDFHIQRVLVVPMPVPAPGLHIEPETTGMRLSGATRGDIDFESLDFSKRF